VSFINIELGITDIILIAKTFLLRAAYSTLFEPGIQVLEPESAILGLAILQYLSPGIPVLANLPGT
jgi:hypothetical protein